MGVKENIVDILLSKKTLKKPTVIKEFEKENDQLRDLISLSERVTDKAKRAQILLDIKLLKYGLDGEQNVNFELMNSFIPMLILHDVRLEHEGYVAQMDFIVITYRFIMVLETKKLSGDIEINADGDFIRSFKSSTGKVYKKEGVYSPISQNERHIKILKEVLYKEELINKYYPFRSAVIMANPKAIINKNRCPKSIKDNLYRHDQLVNYLKKCMAEKIEIDNLPDRRIHKIAEFLKEQHKPANYDYMAKYGLREEDLAPSSGILSEEDADKLILEMENTSMETPVLEKPTEPVVANEDVLELGTEIVKTPLYQALKDYRLVSSKRDGVPAYAVYTNAELGKIALLKPNSIQELYDIKIIGQKKVDKYGEGIIQTIRDNS